MTTKAEVNIADTAIPPAPAEQSCPLSRPAESGPADLTWLLHRAAQRMRTAIDEVARRHGLVGARDWLVLSALAEGQHQTQLSLAHEVGLDKTTLTSLLDRLENRGLITRCLAARDRRARIPVLTDAGRTVQAKAAAARDHAEAEALSGFTPAEQHLLRTLLARLATDQPAAPSHGSCI